MNTEKEKRSEEAAAAASEKHLPSHLYVTKLTMCVWSEGWNGTCRDTRHLRENKKITQHFSQGHFKSDGNELNLTLIIP